MKKILRESTDGDEVRRAWEASKQIGAQVADRVRRVVRLRNQAAQAMGFANYYSLTIPSNAEYAVPQLRMLIREVEEIIEREITPETWNNL